MGRKLRLYSRKSSRQTRSTQVNQVDEIQPLIVSISLDQVYRGPLIVSLPLDHVYLPCVVSLPLDAFLQSSISSITVLQRRLLHCLPDGWNISLSDNAMTEKCLVFNQVSSAYGNDPVVSRVIKVSESMKCSVCIYNKLVPWAQTIVCVADIVDLLKLVERKSLCSGNSDSSFVSICRSRNLMFHNQSGMYL